MIKRIILLTSFLFFVENSIAFEKEEFTTWKCAVYPKTDSPYTKNYAIIQFNGQKAINLN